MKLHLARLTQRNLYESLSSPKRRRQTGFKSISTVGKSVLQALCILLELEGILHDKIPSFTTLQKTCYACINSVVSSLWCIWSHFQGSCGGVFLTSSFCSHLMTSFLYSALFSVQRSINQQTWLCIMVAFFWHTSWFHCFCYLSSLPSYFSVKHPLFLRVFVNREWIQWRQQDGKGLINSENKEVFNVCICSKSYLMLPKMLFCFHVLKGKNKLKKHEHQFVMQSI